MDAVMDFLNMGGYAGFVWPSYGLTVVVLLALVIQTLSERRRNMARLDALRAATRDPGAS